ncbi:WAT1-related protein At3g28050-like isoform X1 [Eucalyptus grandis]|uniref:WAT1-related protein At3g28050-like isoform X1 n=1 Tax=Eucalyptus grandis TaxID=71139 RepID=UPI00192E76B3|nr:WAT1-related protein At3g28050-like isoform X1 [Eucalyptus grandis]
MEMEGRAGASLPFVGMIMVVLVQASSMVVAKMAMSDGLNKYTLAFYCNALSSLVLLPCPFIISRKSRSRPPLTFSVLRKIFLLALVGSASQICGYAGISNHCVQGSNSSPLTFAAFFCPSPSPCLSSLTTIELGSRWVSPRETRIFGIKIGSMDPPGNRIGPAVRFPGGSMQ